MKAPSTVDVQREIGLRGSLFAFVRLAWPILFPSTPLRGRRLVEEVCRHLEAVTRGQCKRLKIHVPPGHSKSTIVSVLWPVWEWIRFPHLRVYGVSYDQSLSGRDARTARRLMQTEWFRERWGDLFQIRGSGEEDYENTRGGFRKSTSVGGALTGWHMERLIVDDPTKPANITEAGLAAAERWWKETVVGRINEHLAIVLIMQRLHEGDLSGLLDGPEWIELRLPAWFEPDTRCTTPFGGDWRTEPDEVLAPDLQSNELLREKASPANMGSHTAAAQLQQRPASKQGLIFRVEWFQHWETLPSEKPSCIALTADCAFKGKTDSDRVSLQAWALYGAAHFYLLDEVTSTLGFVDTLKAMRAFRAKWKDARVFLVEDKANGPAVMDVLSLEIQGLIAWNPGADDKRARAHAITGPWEAKQVWLPSRHTSPWVEEYKAELSSFPVGKKDDRIDAMSQAFAYLKGQESRYTNAIEARKRQLGLA